MPCISLPYDPALGAIIYVLVSSPAVLRQLIVPAGTPPPPTPATLRSHPPVTLNGALIDTGASITSITGAVATQLNLPLIGKRQLGTAGGTVNANVYVADLAIPLGPLPQAPIGSQVFVSSLNAVTFESIVMMEFVCNSPHFSMLLGRDILCQGIFSLGFDRRFTFSF